MKLRVIGSLFTIVSLSSLHSFKNGYFTNSKKYECGDIPELNKGIIKYVKENINKKVARGECWDLAAEPLNQLGANWDKMYVFGKKIDNTKECVFPGDIIQFEGVVAKVVKGNVTITAHLEHHTAIIYEVKDKNNFVLAHQNTGDWGRKVGLSDFNVNDITQGSFSIYQPTKN